MGGLWYAAMLAGDFHAAFAVNDRVLAGRDPATADDPALPYHLRWVWTGRPVEGRHVLVRCYHGLGDTIQFARYLPALRARAASLTLEVQPALLPLLGGIPFDPAHPAPPAECDVEIMELAHALRLPPDPSPYLSVPPGPVRARTAPQIGLCWRANAGWRPERSLPDDALAPLLRHATHSLQPGIPAGLVPCPQTLLGTARLIARLDLVITVDTMVAHLAGALGTPVRLLLDAEPDWRWRAPGNPWYARLRRFVQPAPGDWATPVAALVDTLAHKGTVPIPRCSETE